MKQFLGYQVKSSSFLAKVCKVYLFENLDCLKVEAYIEGDVLHLSVTLNLQGEINRMRECYEGRL